MHALRTLLLALVIAALAPASAQALTLEADSPSVGHIRLTVADAGDATSVKLDEQVGAATDAVGTYTPQAGQVVVRDAAIWLCDRTERHFLATAQYPDGTAQSATATIRTPSCAKRFRLSIHNMPGRIRVTVVDRWKVGHTTADVCVRRPGAGPRCRGFALGGRTFTRGDVSTRKGGGVWTISAGAATRVAYVRPPGQLRLLATGDSMMQILDTYLKERLAPHRVRVKSDARESTGISKPFLLDWVKHARGQAHATKPDVTVVAIGANDGFSFGSVECCGDKWVDAYAARVRKMMLAYARENRGIVYWLTLPAPRPAQWRRIYPAVNKAIKRAAATFSGVVHVVDIAKTFTPGFRFRQYMTWRGKRTNVRAPDGVHLSPAGASIAEALVERALRADHVI